MIELSLQFTPLDCYPVSVSNMKLGTYLCKNIQLAIYVTFFSYVCQLNILKALKNNT